MVYHFTVHDVEAYNYIAIVTEITFRQLAHTFMFTTPYIYVKYR